MDISSEYIYVPRDGEYWMINAPEEHIMYLTVVSWFLISFVMVASSSNKFLYAPAPPPPSVWALKPPSWALVRKTCTYDLYSHVHNVLDACISITWASGRGLGPWILEFLGPKWHSPIGSMPFHRAQQISNSRAQPPPTCPRNGYACIQNIMHARGCINQSCIKSYYREQGILAAV